MLLVLDAGNTQTLIGLFDGDALVANWRIATNAERTADEHALIVTQLLELDGRSLADAVTGMAISSTVPSLKATLRAMASRWFHVPLVVLEPGVRTGIAILADNPREVGADRIANALSVHHLYGGPAIVVDFGTSTNFDVVSAKGSTWVAPSPPGSRSAWTLSCPALPLSRTWSWWSPAPPSARRRWSACSPGSSTVRPGRSTACAGASRPSWPVPSRAILRRREGAPSWPPAG